MSHFTRLRTSLVDGDLIEAALQELGRPYARGSVKIAGYQGSSASAEFRIPTTDSRYDIGLVKGTHAYDLVADWWGIRDTSADEFSGELTRAYSVLATRRTLSAQGFNIISEAVDEAGTTRLVLRRMA